MRINSIIRRKWPLILLVFGSLWIIFIISNARTITDNVEVKIDNKELKEEIKLHDNTNLIKSDKEKIKINGAESDIDFDANNINQINGDEDRGIENADPFDGVNSEEKIVIKAPIKEDDQMIVNPKIQELVNEERWGLDKIPEVNLTELAVINGLEEAVSNF